ncbi:hypothetical protein AOC36_10690 [Erysipelothrix larvae]|uniref:Sulfatase N-terminal domain-containing protein n=1 Tax=Erysipelothrix larvae TaxID=1514105 RepID=A0A0X8H1N3_9FIRM|nr:sulfatase-like hydrolase/transferase [Erysipelothrix larvae]AMC94421.1 hypothetical protein AOC36_10690 [Erysipelothrix larvae]
MKREKYKLYTVISALVLLISIFIFGFTAWMVMNFGDVSFEQYYFSITSPTDGTPMSFYLKILQYVLLIIVVTILVSLVYVRILKKVKARMLIKKIGLGLVTLSIFAGSIVYMNTSLKISKYFFADKTTFFEENYVLPSSEILKFPQQKKNLIFIYVESYETTYLSKELGGNVDRNLIPNLTNIVNEKGSINFSNTDKLGGPFQAPETGYSIAAMYASQSGLPFKVPTNGNDYGNLYEFAPGTITLGDILKKEGYNTEFLVGADGVFAGVNNFYKTHGDFNILDLTIAKEKGLIPQDYSEWWGFEDKKLFEFSKQRLEEVSKLDDPFMMVIEADDSHFPDGYTDKSCPTDSTQPYENSISCVDGMVSDFIKYVQAQDYYEDTVIIVHGDHLSMEKNYFKTLDQNYLRTTFNAYINVDDALIKAAKNKNREMYIMDVFPTTLAAIGVDIKGDRLGLGTNLFSNVPTLYEYYGMDHVNEHLSNKSEYFFEEFLFSTKEYK